MRNARKIENDCMVFFDGCRVDHLVRGFNTNHSKDASMPSAMIRLGMSFGKNLTKEQYEVDYRTAREDIIALKKSLKEGTKIFIAIKNVITGKYVIVFNGSLRALSREGSKARRYVGITVSAVGSIESANKLESILSLPRSTQLLDDESVDAFKLKARGLDITNAKTMDTLKGIKMNELTISQICEKTKEALLATNKLYQNQSSTQNFEKIMDRIKILSDIDERLIRSDLLDLTVDVSTMKVETIYTTLYKALARVMFEFYEMPYGDIVVKTPFWNTPVLRDHVIPGIFISDESDNLTFDARITRELVSGGLSQKFSGSSIEENTFQFAIPMALYTEDLNGKGYWADVRNTALSGTAAGGGFTDAEFNNLWRDVSGNFLYQNGQTGNPLLDAMRDSGWLVSYNLTGKIKYVEYANREMYSDAYHIGWKGIVKSILSSSLGALGPEYAPKRSMNAFETDRSNVVVEYTEGPYKGFYVVYGGVTDIYSDFVKIGETVKDGTKLGRIQRLPDQSAGANQYISVLYPDYQTAIDNEERASFLSVSPIAVFRDFYAGKEEASSIGIKLTSINELSTPRDAEFLYGMKYSEENQPIIRFLTTANDQDVVDTLKRFAAFRLKSKNANVSTLSLNTAVPMPWIYPGFNVWVEPEALDEVYYVQTVGHSYSADEKIITTTLFLTMGRDAEAFFTGSFDGNADNDFGTLMSGGTFGTNIFLSNDTGAKAFFNSRDTVDSFSASNHYKSLRDKAIKFKSSGLTSYNISSDEFMKFLFGSTRKVNNLGSGSDMGDFNFSGEYEAAHLENTINALFKTNTKSSLIKMRNSDISRVINNLEAIRTFE